MTCFKCLAMVLDGEYLKLHCVCFEIFFSRSNIEIDFLNRKVELVHNDSISNREDVARMISELTLKVMMVLKFLFTNYCIVDLTNPYLCYF